jgi:sugar O-acyltransferase (sialic acid O-acetyltransferase NeuD family)
MVYGAGGHGLVVAEAATLSGWHVLAFVDDALRPAPDPRWEVLQRRGGIGNDVAWIVAIGENGARCRIIEALEEEDRSAATVVHPTAFISPSARLGPWCVVGPGAVLHSHAVVERGAILNSNCVVEHHAAVRAFAHVAPGAVLGGGAAVGREALVGLGARVLPNRAVGDGATVGAGAVVIDDVPAGTTVVGVPARTAMA